MQTDYARLYTHLGVDQDCSLDEFKHACRRRINELHPDRRATDAPVAPIAIDEIIALYTRAVRFHRRHGRLPGAAPALRPLRRVSVPRLTPLAASETAISAHGNASGGGSQRTAVLAMVLLCVAITGLALWTGDDVEQSVESAALVAQDEMKPSAALPVRATHLRIGMDVATVRAIQGEPFRSGGGLWEYGPSWLRIERNRLVDWHSSTMHPLEVMSDKPPPRVTQSP